MNTFIVKVNDPKVRKVLSKHGKVGKPQSLSKFIVFTTSLSKKKVENIDGVIKVEENSFQIPLTVNVQKNPESWFLPSSSNTSPDYHYSKTGNGVNIYIMDSGIRLDHEEFEGRDIKTVFSHDGLNYSTEGIGPQHGTMCASCAAGNKYGIAKAASIRNVRYNFSSIEGIKALDTILAEHIKGASPSILSMSFGSFSAIFTEAIEELADAGILLVAAAGNFNSTPPMYPAAHPKVIAVAACNENLEPSHWGLEDTFTGTHYGPEIDIWAGGSNGVAADIDNRTDKTVANGTSFSCPLVAGALSLLLEGNSKPTTLNEANVYKEKLLEQSRKDVIKYTNEKYNDTPNRYLYTAPEKNKPIPTPPKKDKKSSDNSKWIIAAFGILIIIAIFLNL